MGIDILWNGDVLVVVANVGTELADADRDGLVLKFAQILGQFEELQGFVKRDGGDAHAFLQGCELGLVDLVGSANLNARSLRWDYEENAVIVDSCTTKELSDMFNRDKKDSFRLTQESWDQWRTPWKKFVGWFAHLLAPFL